MRADRHLEHLKNNAVYEGGQRKGNKRRHNPVNHRHPAVRIWTAKKHAMLGHLFQCFYCLSHWVVFAGMLIYRPYLLHSGMPVIDWIMTAFVR